MTSDNSLSRREVLAVGAGALALWTRLHPTERTIPWLDQPARLPEAVVELMGGEMSLLDWQELDAWLTPRSKFFRMSHYPIPTVADPSTWALEITGLVEHPRIYRYEELLALPRREIVFAMECSGNSGLPWFEGGIGNARWGGTPLAPLLQAAGPREAAVEVVFFGADGGKEKSRYVDGGGVKLGEIEMQMDFARSMSLADALALENLLCDRMNGEPLPPENGFPLRLIAPGWYGIANVKWLERIELRDARFMGPYMSERYVSVREEPRPDGGSAWTRTSVGRSRLKSIPARITVANGRHRIYGAAWGAPVERVEVKIDGSEWKGATIDEGLEHDHAWKLWHLDWPGASPGEHTVTSRAIDRSGNVQPAPDDWMIANKHTYWESNGQITRTIRIG